MASLGLFEHSEAVRDPVSRSQSRKSHIDPQIAIKIATL